MLDTNMRQLPPVTNIPFGSGDTQFYPRHLATVERWLKSWKSHYVPTRGRITQWLHLRGDSQCAGQLNARAMGSRRIVQWLTRTNFMSVFDWNRSFWS